MARDMRISKRPQCRHPKHPDKLFDDGTVTSIFCLFVFLSACVERTITAMLPIIPLLIGAIPVLTFASFCGIAIYYLISEKKHKQQLGKYYNHPDHDRPLYNMGHCDRYSAGTFSW
ncbi:MAG: hypothetical protein H6R04_543 [Burkholderiaceae bacterium]|nr:hypothetical protein [Burkholderiaceae bacterium]